MRSSFMEINKMKITLKPNVQPRYKSFLAKKKTNTVPNLSSLGNEVILEKIQTTVKAEPNKPHTFFVGKQKILDIGAKIQDKSCIECQNLSFNLDVQNGFITITKK